jgi:hypothetical protein
VTRADDTVEPGQGAPAEQPPRGPVVPRQRRRDAYTLYAEIYALRLDLDASDGA